MDISQSVSQSVRKIVLGSEKASEVRLRGSSFPPIVLGQGFSRSVDPLPKGSDPLRIRQIMYNSQEPLKASNIKHFIKHFRDSSMLQKWVVSHSQIESQCSTTTPPSRLWPRSTDGTGSSVHLIISPRLAMKTHLVKIFNRMSQNANESSGNVMFWLRTKDKKSNK